MDFVGDYQHAVTAAYFGERLELPAAPDISARIVRVAQYQHLDRPFSLQQALQMVQVHPAVLHGIPQHLAAVAQRNVGERMVDRGLHHHLVARFREEVDGEPYASHYARNEADPVAVDLPAVFLQFPLRNHGLHLRGFGVISVYA